MVIVYLLEQLFKDKSKCDLLCGCNKCKITDGGTALFILYNIVVDFIVDDLVFGIADKVLS